MPNPGNEKIENQNKDERKKKNIIQIPSYDEVFNNKINNSSSNSDPKPYNPPNSFSQAFSFVKSSEFYAPPPPPLIEPTRTVPEPLPSTSSNNSTSNYNNSSVKNRNAILVSHRQKGNPLLKHIRNVRWVFGDIVCDYLLGQSSCALYLSLRYHLLHPDYLYFRIRELEKNFKLRVVLCHVDLEDVIKPLLEVTKTAMLHDCTLLCGWSLEECGRYLETIKVYENKSSDLIREQTDTDYLSRLTRALTEVRHVNKTDVVTLGSAFGSLSGIMDASMEDLARCPGIGERKVKRLYDTFHEPFRWVPKRPAATEPEPLAKDKNAGESSSVDDSIVGKGKDLDDASAATKKPALNVKSALSAAFAKYADKIQKPESEKSVLEKGESSSGTASKN